MKRRRLLEKKNLTAAIFEAINKHLAEKGLMMHTGNIVDATIIAAPSSTKNKDIVTRKTRRRSLPKTPWSAWMEQIERLKARMGPKVEHPFHGEEPFHHRKIRNHGLDKNTKQLITLFGLANLVLARKWLLAPEGQSAS